MRLLRLRWWLQRNFVTWLDRIVLTIGGAMVIYAGFISLLIQNLPFSVLMVLVGLYIMALPWMANESR